MCPSEGVEPVSLISLRLLTLLGDPGNTSSTGFLRMRLGDPAGLAGRWGGKMIRFPAASTRGMECALDIGGARGLVVERDLRWPRLKGEVLRGRKGMVGGDIVGERGERSGSVARR